MEGTADVDGLSPDLSTGNHVVREDLPLDEQPGGGSLGTPLVEEAGTVLSVLEPLLESPDSSLLL